MTYLNQHHLSPDVLFHVIDCSRTDNLSCLTTGESLNRAAIDVGFLDVNHSPALAN